MIAKLEAVASAGTTLIVPVPDIGPAETVTFQ